ncbi:carboxynorspermidine decarboxylase [Puniceicoccus vermicola]|nr:carboxynorspermidine decarboxylase [Puniceicoccus vermicola]
MSDIPIHFPTGDELKLILRESDSPSYVMVERAFRENLEKLRRVKDESGATVLLALKGFACRPLLPLVGQYVDGACASSPHEAQLAREEVGGEVHIFAPAYRKEDFEVSLPLVNHVVFNSLSQKDRWIEFAREGNGSIDFGLRVNPEHSEGHTPLYDPCSPGSRLGIRSEELSEASLEGIDGLHFHTLCEHNSDALERTLAVVVEKFGWCFPHLKWINFGGGHHVTRDDYDIDRLIRIVREFREKTGLKVYLEPGEAFGLNTGVLVTTVLDITENHGRNVILDTSVTAHMPDVLEMPYRPEIYGAARPNEKPYTYRLGGLTCLAGDVIGEYSFDQPLEVGDRIVFGDMGHYTMVKNTTFNGIQLPSIAVLRENGEFETARRFGYETFRDRLG